MKPFTESMRYEYPLTPDSVVIDVGGYKGDWTAEIFKRYGCKIWVFEPCNEFYKNMFQRFAGNERIRVINAAVGRFNQLSTLYIKGDMTGFHTEGTPQHVTPIWPVNQILMLLGQCDLMKLNCEGSEYEILEGIIGLHLQHMLKNIQVQFHGLIGYEQRYEQIRSDLLKTHRLTYDSGMVWSNFERIE